MSDRFDTGRSGGAHGAAGSGAAADVARTLLVIVQPPAAADDAAAAAARVALAAEANRLTAALDALVGFATWSDTADPDFLGLATAVAAEARGAGGGLAAVLIQDGDLGRQLAPQVARLLGSAAVLGASDARVGPAGQLVFVKPVYGGWLEQEVAAAEGFVPVVTLDLSDFEPSEAAAAQAAAALADAEVLTASAGSVWGAARRVRHIETLPPKARSVDLVHAKRIVTAGMGAAGVGATGVGPAGKGVSGDTRMAAVHELADLLDGSVGATRPVVDEGRLPKERLIGQTGRTVTPELYVALGVSGSPHHVAGVRKADRVLSINRDVRAPIFQFSDVGYVADLEEVLPMLIEKIKAWRDAPAAGDAPSVGDEPRPDSAAGRAGSGTVGGEA